MRDVEVTPREVLVSVVIVLLMVGIGFFIAESIHNKVSVDNEQYFKALKIDNNPELFDYAIKTEVGNMLSYGKFKANEPVSDRLIKGEYFSIIKTEEHYVMKTRTVTYTDSNGKTKTRTETYWEWDEVDEEQFKTDTFNYLGRNFKYKIVPFRNYKYKETVKTSSHVRFIFYVIPEEFNGTLYSKAKSKTITDTKLYSGDNIKDVIADKEGSADNAVLIFWICWILLTSIIVVVFVVLENRYINDN